MQMEGTSPLKATLRPEVCRDSWDTREDLGFREDSSVSILSAFQMAKTALPPRMS